MLRILPFLIVLIPAQDDPEVWKKLEPLLEQLSNDDPKVRAEAQDGIVGLGEAAIPFLRQVRETLDKDDDHLRAEIDNAIRSIENPLGEKRILEKAYDRTYKVPKDFYKDPSLKGRRSLYFHQADWYSDDRDRAREIIKAFLAKPSNIEVKMIEAERETKIYFEFRAGNICYRVHRPSYVAWTHDRIWNGRNHESGGLLFGHMKVRPLTGEAVKELAQYYWLIQNHNTGGSKVLKATSVEYKDRFVHTLITTAITYGDWGIRDEIRVIKVTNTVYKADGAFVRKVEVLRKLKGRGN
jgi:hypothetical protein